MSGVTGEQIIMRRADHHVLDRIRDEPDDEPPPAYPSRGTVVAKIPLSSGVGSVVVSPDNSHVYVALGDSIAVIDSAHRVLGIIPVSGHPRDLTIGVDATRLYVSHYEGCVSIIRVADHRGTVIAGASCPKEVVTPHGTFIYAAHNAKVDGRWESWVLVIDTEGEMVAAIPGVDDYAVTDLAAGSDGTRVYVGLSQYSAHRQHGTGLAGVIDTATCAPTDIIDLGASPDNITVNSDGSMMYATHHDTNSVSGVDLVTQDVTQIALGDAPLGLTLTPDGSQGYAVNRRSLSVIDTVTNEATHVSVGDLPRCVQISQDGKRAYVSNFGGHTVSVIDTVGWCVTGTIDVGGHPEALAVNPDGDRLYISDYWSRTVTVAEV